MPYSSDTLISWQHFLYDDARVIGFSTDGESKTIQVEKAVHGCYYNESVAPRVIRKLAADLITLADMAEQGESSASL